MACGTEQANKLKESYFTSLHIFYSTNFWNRKLNRAGERMTRPTQPLIG